MREVYDSSYFNLIWETIIDYNYNTLLIIEEKYQISEQNFARVYYRIR